MRKLENSIRKELKFYGPGLRFGHYGAPGFTAGLLPEKFNGYISSAVARYDKENEVCTEITLYCVGDGFSHDDFYQCDNATGIYCDITENIIDFIKNDISCWNDLIIAIYKKILEISEEC